MQLVDAPPAADEAHAPAAPAGAAPALPARSDVVVVGAGVIGLSVAWRAAQAGIDVVVADAQPARGASWVAAGMLAPVTEVRYDEEALLELNLAGARRWDGFAAALEAVAGPFGYRPSGTLLVAAEEDDRVWAKELFAFEADLGLDVQWLTGSEARRMEPALAPGVRGALWAPGDHQVDNRRLLEALLVALAAAGGHLVRQEVVSLERAGGALCGVRLASGEELACRSVVLAAGCRSGQLGGLPPEARPPVRPVKGQILRLGPGAGGPSLSRSVRAVVEGSSLYLVPRQDGTVVVGATVEEQGFDTAVGAGAVYEMLRDAHRVVPAISEMVLAEASAGLRPASPDNGPLVGPSPALDGLVVATGHYRNGILLAPLTAEAVVAVLRGEAPPAELAPFAPARFGAPGP
jgi:glycine oxidase